MEQLVNLLAVTLPEWELPWAGIGAALAGLGSFLSGYAALKAARRQGNSNEKADNSSNGKS
jgi:hypothetical protein